MTNYKVQFEDKNGKPIKKEILVVASSIKAAVREACRIGGFDYPSKNKAKVSEVKIVKSKSPKKEVEAKSTVQE